MLSSILQTLYGSLWKAAIPVLQRHKRLKIGFEQRLVPDSWPNSLPNALPDSPPNSLPGLLHASLPVVLPDSCTDADSNACPSAGELSGASASSGPNSLSGARALSGTGPFPDSGFSASEGPRLWLQAASGGEATLLFSLIEAFCHEYTQAFPKAPPPSFLCTTCTKQGMDIINKESASLPQKIQTRCTANYFPLDAPVLMRKALQQARPDLVILLETELWPGLLHELKRAKIPYGIANARMTTKTCRAYKKARLFFKSHQPGLVCATTTENARRFEEVFALPPATAPHITPNIKFDIIHRQLSQQKNEPSPEYEAMASYLSACLRAGRVGTESPASALVSEPKASTPPPLSPSSPILRTLPPLIALASVREEEEEALEPILEAICRYNIQDVPALCLLAPRHLHRVPFWQEHLKQAKIPFVRKSELVFSHSDDGLKFRHGSGHDIGYDVGYSIGHDTSGPSDADAAPPSIRCILWDTFGELDLLYALADEAFVGGSLAPLGGQNFLEPLAQGTTAVIGPSWSNFSWVGEELFEQGIIVQESTPEKVAQKLLSLVDGLLSAPREQWSEKRTARKAEVRSRLYQNILAHTGGSALTAKHILSVFAARFGGQENPSPL